MEFRVLGPVQVFDGRRRITLGGPQPEKALATLLLAGGRTVHRDAIVEALWDGEPPPTARHQVHKLIATLRRRIPGTIDTDGPGYRMRLDGSTVDAIRFAELAAVPTIPALTAALRLWRGPALTGVDSRALRAPAAALDDRRLAAIETLADLRMAAGDAAGVAAELPGIVAAYPLRETLRGRLMIALYRSGRQAEALAVYAETRALFAEELGTDPGPELVRLHQRLLRGDAGQQPSPRRPPRTLPYDLPDFAGRGDELERLLGPASAAADGAAVVISAIDGMAGIGKTALAVHAAHRLAPRHPDGQLFLDLHAHTPGSGPVDPAMALELLLRMLGVATESIPDGLDARAARWRAELAGRRVLVVLDNASSAAQVRPLLPGMPGCLALVTSRRRLGALDGATVLSLDVLAPTDAVELFAAVVGAARAAAEPVATAEVVRLCGHLPLAIRIAATRLARRPLWTVETLAARLRTESVRLDELEMDDRGVGSAFALSYAQLTHGQQRIFRLLGLHPGADFDAYAAAALAGIAPHRAELVLEELVDAHLLQARTAGRYTFHDLLREYAQRLAGAAADAEVVATDGADGANGDTPRDGGGRPSARLYDYYLAAATVATDAISREARRFEPVLAHPPAHLPPLPDMAAALAWLSAEHGTLLDVAAAAVDWQLAGVLRAYFEHRGHFADWRATHERVLSAGVCGRRGTALIRFNMAALAMWTNRPAEGMDHLRIALAHNDDDTSLEATALTNLGMLAHLLHQDTEAEGYLRRALSLTHDSPRTTALGWNNLGLTEGRLGRRDAALRHHRRALALAREIGSRTAERGILLGLGETSLRLGLPAERPFREAMELARTGHFRMQEALALDGLAHATGERRYWRQALDIFLELGVPQADLVRMHLDQPGTPCCDLCRAVPRAARPGLVGV